MPRFAYTARSGTHTIKGVVTAPDKRNAINTLRHQKLIVIDISEKQAGRTLQFLSNLNPFQRKVPAKELVLFSRQFSTLISAGVPIVQGLSILVEQISSSLFKRILTTVREDIEQGVSISDAMSKHPKAFSELYVSMIRSGEVGGILEVILERLSGYLEDSEELRNKVRSAMVYPGVVSFVAISITTFMLIFVLPRFQLIFKSFNATLPAPTLIMIEFSIFLRDNFYYIIAAIAAIIIGFHRWRKTEKGAYIVDSFLLRLPIVGNVIRKVAIAKFSRTFGILIKSGVPILQAIESVAKTSGNKVIEQAIEKSKESIKEGERMAEPLRRTGVFPIMVTQMIAIGEETGNLETMLSKVADFYDREVDASVKALASVLEPVIIVFMGLIIGAIVLSMFLPIFQLGQLAGKIS